MKWWLIKDGYNRWKIVKSGGRPHRVVEAFGPFETLLEAEEFGVKNEDVQSLNK